MLTAVKSQIRISMLSIKYAVMRELMNKVSFFANVFFMMVNNATFLIQWALLFSVKNDFGGYSFKQVMILWAFAASTFGLSNFFFKNAHNLSDMIVTGKLDVYLVQPKSVLISAITSDVSVSALGDFLYGYIILFICGCTFKSFLLFTIFSILGGLIATAFAVILGSLSFYISRADAIAENGERLFINFATYPDGIFKGVVKLILYTIVPVGFSVYIPTKLLTTFDTVGALMVIMFTIGIVALSVLVFYRGLRRYSSSNLMNART